MQFDLFNDAQAGAVTASPIKYHGGKSYLAKRIVAMMPAHACYLEAFAGGLSVLFAKDGEGVAEFVNDLHGDLTNFWRVLRDEFDAFHRIISCTPLSEIEFKENSRSDRPVDRAVHYFVRARQSRQGLRRDYCTPTKRLRQGMNENVSAWLTAVDGLPEIHQRLRRVEIWNRSAVDAIKKLDRLDLLVYADPPYVHETRSTTGEYGQFEMTTAQHVELLECLSGMQGKFLLSGYRCELYDDYAATHGWRCDEFELPNNASSKATKARKIECIWSLEVDSHG